MMQFLLLAILILFVDAAAAQENHENENHVRHGQDDSDMVDDQDHSSRRHARASSGGIFYRYFYSSPSPPPFTGRVRGDHAHWTDPPNVIKRGFFLSPPPNTVPSPAPTVSGGNGDGSPSPVPTIFPSDSPSSSPLPPSSSPPPTATPSLSPSVQDSCDNVVDFESRILVGLTGKPEDVSSQEIEALKQGFIDAYTAAECGDRNISNVTIVTSPLGGDNTDSISRALQGSSANYRPFTYIFVAGGQCRGCKQNKRLFDQAIGRALGQEATGTSSRYLQDCPCVPPSEDTFLRLFNETIAELVSNGNLVNIVGVTDNFSELEELNCTAEVTEFESTVSLTFQGEADTDISESELIALEGAFVDAYNEVNGLNSETCDLSFLVAVEAELTRVDSGRRLQSSGRFKYDVQFGGSCRGCGQNPRLFGESQGRRALSASRIGVLAPLAHHQRARSLQTFNDDCYCPLGEPDLRLASEEEFQLFYNEIIDYLRKEGTLTTITSVVEVSESEPSTPSPTPAPFPSTSPSVAPIFCCELPTGFDAAGNRFGVFTGIVAQGSQRYNVTMTYSSAGIVTDYPSLRCGHESPMTLNVVAKGQLEWTERLDYGLGRCLDRGSVSLTQESEEEWDYRWRGGSVGVDGPVMFQCVVECP